jgi:lipopolysaccharide transport system ATP-binding protein
MNIKASGTPGAHQQTLVRVEGVSKRFCRSFKRSLWYGLKDIVADLGCKNVEHELRSDEFWAIRDLSFELRRGECLGLIGPNGAGKTTLLRMLSGVIKPDIGRIQIHGRTGGLIALGAGFNPILTGRENIYVNASILGISKKETDRKFDEIVDFAELHDSIDTPVQNYSSGMTVRLGFAVAAIIIEPDVLFLDEVLAVGDIGFTIKCLNAVRQLSENSSVIFVSHNMQFVSAFCTRVLVMEHGRAVLDAEEPADGIDQYYSMIKLERQESGTGSAKINYVCLKVEGQEQLEQEPRIHHGSNGSLLIRGEITDPNIKAVVTVGIVDEAMMPIISVPLQDHQGQALLVGAGEFELDVPLGQLELRAGKYSFLVAITDGESNTFLTRVQGLQPFRIHADRAHWGKIVRTARARLKNLRVPS